MDKLYICVKVVLAIHETSSSTQAHSCRVQSGDIHAMFISHFFQLVSYCLYLLVKNSIRLYHQFASYNHYHLGKRCISCVTRQDHKFQLHSASFGEKC